MRVGHRDPQVVRVNVAGVLFRGTLSSFLGSRAQPVVTFGLRCEDGKPRIFYVARDEAQRVFDVLVMERSDVVRAFTCRVLQ